MSLVLLVLFIVLMFLGVPIAVSLGAASVITIITMSDLPLSMAVQSMFTSMNSFMNWQMRALAGFTADSAMFP